jgi:hypothetical protein
MFMAGTALPTAPISDVRCGISGRHRLVQIAGRYSLSAAGPIAVSGAHFGASLMFLHRMSPREFGMFSFLLVVVPFCLSVSSGLLGAPLLNAVGKPQAVAETKGAAFREVNRFYCLSAGLLTGLLMYFSGAGKVASVLLGLYAVTMTFRWYSRYTAYNANLPLRAAASDLFYSMTLLAGLMLLIFTNQFTLHHTSAVMLLSAVLGVLPYGLGSLRNLFHRPMPDFLAVYAPIWRDITRWSLMGVVLSEMTANAHAYLVTFISGPHAFALLAVGSLMMRPLSLVLTALPDRERPVIALRLAAGDTPAALRTIREFRAVTFAVWLATVLLSAVILAWFPFLVIRDGFHAQSVIIGVAIWTLIVGARAVRAPEQAFLTAAGEFHPLARAGLAGSVVSLLGTALLLVLFGPVASLCGILAGEVTMTFRMMSLMSSWRRAHA